MRYINELFTAAVGEAWTNARLLAVYEAAVERLALEGEAQTALRDFVRFQLVGERSRRTVLPDWTQLSDFQSRAGAFETGADMALSRLAEQIRPAVEAAGLTFDAVVTTTSTGNLMPGLSYRVAQRLGGLVRPDSLTIDLGNVGCTGSSKALNIARSLDASYKNILLVALELPTTLVDVRGTDFDLWQGNCTFGDGAAALWISDDVEQGSGALALEEMQYRQFSETGLGLIRWKYRDYYSFELKDHKTFEADVKQFVAGALREAEGGWKEEPRWAIHPAGIALLMRLSRELKMPKDAIQPSVAHYREHSNMSSVSVLFVLKELAAGTPVGAAINLLTMGAGFNVVYGRVRRVR
jgi:predicted naringenin-chalcone synthase